jgi:hypothetical protein
MRKILSYVYGSVESRCYRHNSIIPLVKHQADDDLPCFAFDIMVCSSLSDAVRTILGST